MKEVLRGAKALRDVQCRGAALCSAFLIMSAIELRSKARRPKLCQPRGCGQFVGRAVRQ